MVIEKNRLDNTPLIYTDLECNKGSEVSIELKSKIMKLKISCGDRRWIISHHTTSFPMIVL